MRDKGQILVEVFDSLIKHDSGKIPSEVGELFSLGLRLHNECPDIDPAFMQRLGEQAKGLPKGRRCARPTGLLAFVAQLWCRPTRQRVAAGAVAVACALLISLAFVPAVREAVAGLGHSIPAFEKVDIEERERPDATPWEVKPLYQWTDLDEARLLAGFPLRTPTYLPEGYTFQLASKDRVNGRDRIVLHYGSAAEDSLGHTNGMGLTIQEYPVRLIPTEAILTFTFGMGSTEPMLLAGRPAVFARGQWSPSGGWQPSSPMGVLILQDEHVVLHISGEFSRDEMVQIAKSMLD